MYKKSLWVITLLSAFIFAQMVHADPSVCRERLSKMVESLNLDSDQKAKIQPIIQELKTSLKDSGSQLDGIDSQITAQTNSANMDQDAVNTAVDKKSKLIGDMMKAKIKATNQIFSVLKPEQKQKLQGMIKTSEEKIAALYKNCGQE